MKFFLKCNETAGLCDKSQYKEASCMDIIRMKFHVIFCKYCREYSETNTKLTESIKTADIKSFPNEKKELLKAQINQEMQTKPKS